MCLVVIWLVHFSKVAFVRTVRRASQVAETWHECTVLGMEVDNRDRDTVVGKGFVEGHDQGSVVASARSHEMDGEAYLVPALIALILPFRLSQPLPSFEF